MTVQWAQGFSGQDHKLDLLKLVVVIIVILGYNYEGKYVGFRSFQKDYSSVFSY